MASSNTLVLPSTAAADFHDSATWHDEPLFHSLIQGMCDLTLIVNGRGLVVHVNRGFEGALNCTSADVLGRHALDLFHPDDQPAVRVLLAQTPVASPTPALRLQRRDGSTCPIQVCERTTVGAPEIGWVIIHARDLENLAQLDRALQQNDDAYRDVFAYTPVGLAIATIDGRFLEINPAYLQITGYRHDELLDQTDAAITHPDDRETQWQHISRLLAGEQSAFVFEKRYVRRDAITVSVRATMSLSRDEAGHPARLIIVVENISEQRRLEAAYRQSQKMEAIGRLAGGVAHDFNNLLTVITGYGQIVLDKLPPGDDARDLIYEITRAGERAAALTRQLLVFSRRQIIAPRVLDLSDLIVDAGNMLRRMIGEDVDLVTLSDPDLWPIKADAGQIEQALMNLAVNARDAMPRGGKLTIETRNVRHDETYARTRAEVRPGPYVMLAVSDTGCGMSAEVKAHLFEPFFSTKEPGKGTGLGLATVYGIVKEAQGHIEVYSEPELGTTFKLYFPRSAEGYESSGKSHPDLVVMPPGHETILLVEDEEAVRAMGRYVLLSCGYQVLVAGRGDEALQLAEEHAGAIDLLVTDVVMPSAGGRAVADRLKRLQPGLKVLYLSGYTDDAVVRHGVLERDVAFLQKPFSPAMLAQKVREVLDGGG